MRRNKNGSTLDQSTGVVFLDFQYAELLRMVLLIDIEHRVGYESQVP